MLIGKNRVFLDELPRKIEGGVQIDWKNCIGLSVKYIYKNVEGYFKILKYDSLNNMLDIKINNRTIKCATNQLRRCPFGYVLGYKTTKYKFQIGDIFNNMKILKTKRVPHGVSRHGNPRSEKGYEYECLTCGGVTDIYEYQLSNKIKCPICCNRIIIKGINDIATTHPEFVKYFVNIEDAYTCSYSGSDIFKMQCPLCGYQKDISPNHLTANGIGCQVCSDGVSFPEKFLSSVFVQLEIPFEREVAFSWSEGKRFDFYIDSINCIVETHGIQHYKDMPHYSRTLKEEQTNDTQKKLLSLNNGIKNYIVLDCRNSSKSWIKESILASQLPQLVDIEKVDWDLCDKNSINSLIVDTCKLYSGGMTRTIEIASTLKLSQGTVIKYLHKGTEFGLCKYISGY